MRAVTRRHGRTRIPWSVPAPSRPVLAMLMALGANAGCIVPYESAGEESVGEVRQTQFPDDDGNRANLRVYQYGRADGEPMGRVLTTGKLERNTLPQQAEIWRWDDNAAADIRSGTVDQMTFELIYRPTEWDKEELDAVFLEATTDWLSWTCGRLFEFGRRDVIATDIERGVLLFRIESEGNALSPAHLLELVFEHDAPPGRGPAARFHLDAASVDRYLFEDGRVFPNMDRSEAVVSVEKAQLTLVPGGHMVEIIPLISSAVRGGDCKGPSIR